MLKPSLAALLTPALATLVVLGPAPSRAAPRSIASGAYDNTLMLAVDPASGAVSGYFDMSEPGPPAMSCIFYLKGRLEGAGAAVDTWFPDDPKGDLIRGRLTATGAGKVRVTLPTEHGGCGNVWQFADKDNPADFTLQKAEPWTSVRVVRSDRAWFSPGPGAPHGRAYVVKGDGVGVRAARAGWVQADFFGEKHTSSGWLREADLYPP